MTTPDLDALLHAADRYRALIERPELRAAWKAAQNPDLRGEEVKARLCGKDARRPVLANLRSQHPLYRSATWCRGHNRTTRKRRLWRSVKGGLPCP